MSRVALRCVLRAACCVWCRCRCRRWRWRLVRGWGIRLSRRRVVLLTKHLDGLDCERRERGVEGMDGLGGRWVGKRIGIGDTSAGW